MGKYGKSTKCADGGRFNVNTENELAESNRLKRVELQMKIVEMTGTLDKEFVEKFHALIKLDGAS